MYVQALYWKLPARFSGNKLDSYGGLLNFTIRHNSLTSLPENKKEDREGGAFVIIMVSFTYPHTIFS